MPADGKCYSDTWKFLLEGSKQFPHDKLSTMDYVRVVHGKVLGGCGKRIDHAWVEFGTGPFKWVWEPQLDCVFNAEKYYTETSAIPAYQLTSDELLKLSFRFKNYGPFSVKERLVLK
jgi:hypothetical protein